MFAANQYRCIVKPAAGASLNSSYTHSIPLVWQKTGVNLAAGKYTKVSVKNPSIPLFEDAGVVIAGKIWATRNVDFPGTFAPAPESYGMIYQWNRSVGWLNYSGAPLLNSNGGTTWDATNASGDTWAPENNPCPDGWRVPTKEELQDLRNAGVSNWTSRNGINGRYFGPGGNQIFLPAAGHRGNSNGSFDTVGSCGYYWSSMWYSGIASYHLLFDSGIIYSAVGNRRSYGFSVRCVKE